MPAHIQAWGLGTAAAGRAPPPPPNPSGFILVSGTTQPRRVSVSAVTDNCLGVIVFPTSITVLFLPVVTIASCLHWLRLKAGLFIRQILSKHSNLAN